MAEIITPQQMTETNLRCIKEYTDAAAEGISEVCKDEADNLKTRLKADSPKGTRSGKNKYANSWKVKKTAKSGYVQYEVYNTQGQLTHILEFGHQNFVGITKGKVKQVHTKGGRTRAFPHIKRNEVIAKADVERRIKEVLQNGRG